MKKSGRAAAQGVVRIIAGDLRGSRLAVPDLPGLRPTPDRIRETLFNWLAPYMAGARCLDLYAGSGALGIEALSRGAAQCQFVERDRGACRLLQDNLARLKVTGARVVADDADSFLAGPVPPERFDLVFLDPPFADDLWSATAASLERGSWLRDGTLIYVEAPLEASPALPPGWQLHREGRIGAEHFALYRRTGVDPLS